MLQVWPKKKKKKKRKNTLSLISIYGNILGEPGCIRLVLGVWTCVKAGNPYAQGAYGLTGETDTVQCVMDKAPERKRQLMLLKKYE